MEKSEALDIYNKISLLFPNAKCELNYKNIFELTIATILSSQTTDASVNKITPLLFQKYPDSKTMKDANSNDIESIIKPLGLYHNKAINIINLSKELEEKYNGIIPNDFNALVKLPGIGRKTANVILSEGYDVPKIAVDTHVMRVSNRLGLSNSSNPDKIEEDLMKLFPTNIWKDVHLKLLFFGRYLCTSKNPKCNLCFHKCTKK